MIANIEQCLAYTPIRLTMYKFLIHIITTRPDVEWVKEICSLDVEWIPNVHNESSQTGAGVIRKFVKDYGHQKPEDLSTELAVEWTRVFREIKPGYGPPPARASAYRSCNIPALIEKYQNAGLRPAQNRFEPDYLGIQIAFLYELVKQELESLHAEDVQNVLRLQNEQKDFINTELDWVSEFYLDAEKWIDLPFYKGVMVLLIEFLDEELRWLA